MRRVLQLGETVLMVYALRTFGWVRAALRRCWPGVNVRVRLGVRCGGVAEWLKAHAWKVCMRETVSRVRIPPPPPINTPKHAASEIETLKRPGFPSTLPQFMVILFSTTILFQRTTSPCTKASKASGPPGVTTRPSGSTRR